MGSQVSLPLWVVILMAILAILAALDRILIPSVRWALRRRANRAIEELNTKLKLRIQPFKLDQAPGADRSSGVRSRKCCGRPRSIRPEAGVPNEVAMEKVRRYAREIVPAFSAYAYFRVGTRIARARFAYAVSGADRLSATTRRWPPSIRPRR